MSAGKWKWLKRLLLLGSLLAAAKLIFVDYTLDEEYQIVMAYRYLTGDALFGEMWEPHQTSAFLCAGLMWIFHAVTGSYTGVVLFLRFFSLGVQLALSYGVYRMTRQTVGKDYGWLLGLIYFNISPKNIQGPEFSNMQLWFLTATLLLLWKYYKDQSERQKDHWYLVAAAGLALSGEVLVYPTCVILFPFFLVYLFRRSDKRKWRDVLLLSGACLVTAGIWLSAVLSKVSMDTLLLNVENLLGVDPTHTVSGLTHGKWGNILDNLVMWAICLAAVAAVSRLLYVWVVRKYGKKDKLLWLVLAVLVAEAAQVCIWFLGKGGYEYLQIHLLAILLAAALAWSCAGAQKREYIWPLLATLLAYAAVMYITDLTLYFTLPHGVLGIVCCLLVLVLALEKRLGAGAGPWVMLLLVSFCLCSIFGKGFALRGGKSDNTIRCIGGIMKQGPAAGIFMDYMGAYIYNCNYEDYREAVEEGERLLIVANMVMAPGTTSYLFYGSEISHFSVVDPTTYDERLLEYWQQYPEKQPDVIVVDCWYGQLKENPDSWIMKYIEEEFAYTSVQDGRYVRFYRK